MARRERRQARLAKLAPRLRCSVTRQPRWRCPVGADKAAHELGLHSVRDPFDDVRVADGVSDQGDCKKQRESDELHAPVLIYIWLVFWRFVERTLHGRLHNAGALPRPLAYRGARSVPVNYFTSSFLSPSCDLT